MPLYWLFNTHFHEVRGDSGTSALNGAAGSGAGFVKSHLAELLFRHKLIRLLQGEGLLTQERIELLLWWRHNGFSVRNRVRAEPEDRRGVERLGLCIIRPPISVDRMARNGVGEFRYQRRAGHERSGLSVGWLDR